MTHHNPVCGCKACVEPEAPPAVIVRDAHIAIDIGGHRYAIEWVQDDPIEVSVHMPMKPMNLTMAEDAIPVLSWWRDRLMACVEGSWAKPEGLLE